MTSLLRLLLIPALVQLSGGTADGPSAADALLGREDVARTRRRMREAAHDAVLSAFFVQRAKVRAGGIEAIKGTSAQGGKKTTGGGGTGTTLQDLLTKPTGNVFEYPEGGGGGGSPWAMPDYDDLDTDAPGNEGGIFAADPRSENDAASEETVGDPAAGPRQRRRRKGRPRRNRCRRNKWGSRCWRRRRKRAEEGGAQAPEESSTGQRRDLGREKNGAPADEIDILHSGKGKRREDDSRDSAPTGGPAGRRGTSTRRAQGCGDDDGTFTQAIGIIFSAFSPLLNFDYYSERFDPATDDPSELSALWVVGVDDDSWTGGVDPSRLNGFGGSGSSDLVLLDLLQSVSDFDSPPLENPEFHPFLWDFEYPEQENDDGTTTQICDPNPNGNGPARGVIAHLLFQNALYVDLLEEYGEALAGNEADLRDILADLDSDELDRIEGRFDRASQYNVWMSVDDVRENKRITADQTTVYDMGPIVPDRWAFELGPYLDKTIRPWPQSPYGRHYCVTAGNDYGRVRTGSTLVLKRCTNEGKTRKRQTWVFCGISIECKARDVLPPLFTIDVVNATDETEEIKKQFQNDVRGPFDGEGVVDPEVCSNRVEDLRPNVNETSTWGEGFTYSELPGIDVVETPSGTFNFDITVDCGIPADDDDQGDDAQVYRLETIFNLFEYDRNVERCIRSTVVSCDNESRTVNVAWTSVALSNRIDEYYVTATGAVRVEDCEIPQGSTSLDAFDCFL